MNQLVIIAYDIPADRRRTRVAKLLEDYGQRVQYSVFEARLSAGQLKQLMGELRKLVDVEQDSVRFYRLCAACCARVELVGVGEVTTDVDTYII